MNRSREEALGRSIRPWPLGQAERLRHPKLTLVPAVGALWLVYFWLSGAWLPDAYSHRWSSPRQITGMTLTYTLLLSYLTGFFIYTSKRTLDHVETLRSLFTGPEVEARIAELNRVDPVRYALATAAGVALGIFNVDWSLIPELGTMPHWPADLSLFLGSMLVWVFAAQVIYCRSHSAYLLSGLGRDLIEVDLYQTRPLEAFARVGILDVLLVMGALAITPLQALDAEFRSYNYLFAFLVALPAGLFLLVRPMWGVHRRLRQARKSALAEVDSRIADAARDATEPALSHLNALIERRAFLQGVHTWPMDLRGISRVAFYFVIPPLAWVGAALVEILLEGFLHTR